MRALRDARTQPVSTQLYGVAGRVHIRASKDGYFDKTEPIDVAAHSSLAFEMKPFEPTEDYSGVYTLLITGDRCTPGFPEFAKTRLYTARLEQSGAVLAVDPSDATSSLEAGSVVCSSLMAISRSASGR